MSVLTKLPDVQRGGTDAVDLGSLKRKLDTIVLGNLTSAATFSTETITQRTRLWGITRGMAIQIAAGFVSNVTESPILPASILAGSVRYQLTPINNFPDSSPMYLRPLFQDETLNLPHENHPLSQDLPHSWEFSTSADMVLIETVIDQTLFGASGLNGRIVIQVTLDYIQGNTFFDVRALQYAISNARIQGNTPVIVGTGGEG